MKNFWIFIFFIFSCFLLWLFSLQWGFDSGNFYSKEVLAKSTPINVRIDVDLIKSLSPAYER